MLDHGIYLGYRAATALTRLVPLRLLYHLGGILGVLASFCAPQYRRIVLRNLEIVFAEKMTPSERRGLARRHFYRLGANIACGLKMTGMPLEAVRRCVEIDDASLAITAQYPERPLIVILSHAANWEAMAQMLPALFVGARMGTVYQPLRNTRLDEALRKQRARAGLQLFDRSQGFVKAAEFVRSGAALGIFADQHAGNHGVWVPFFNRLASSTILPALLARGTGADVLVAAVRTIAPGRWGLSFTPALNTADDTLESLTAKISRAFEEQVLAAPEDWFWLHNRWKTPEPNFLLTDYKRGIFYPPWFEREKLQPFRILVRSPNWLGDSVIAAEAVRSLKHGRPDAHLTVAAPAKLAPFWRLLPEVDEVLALPANHLLGTVRLLRAQPRFDVAVLLPNSLRTALEVFLAGVPRRIGFRGNHRAWLLNQFAPERKKPGPIEHQVHRYARLAKSLGAPAISLLSFPPLPANGVVKLGLCPGAEYGPAKRWLPERFAEVANAIAAEHPVQWQLFGTATDQPVGEIIAAQLGERAVNRIGQTSLEELIAELRACRLLLTNDTGTMHLAALLGVPVVAIFGSTEHRLTGPLGDGHTVMRRHVACSPCFLRECPIDFRCMKEVTAEEVTAAVRVALGKNDHRAATATG